MTAANNEELLATTWRDGVQYVWLSDHSRIVTALRARVAELEQANTQLSGESTEWIVKLREAESQLRQVKADAAVARVDPANEQMPYPHIVRLRELTEADVGSKLYAAAPPWVDGKAGGT